MSLNRFIKFNNPYWEDFIGDRREGKILIEEPNICFITHLLCIQCLVISKAKLFLPIWMRSNNTPLELLQSYDSMATYAGMHSISPIESIYIKIFAFISYCRIFFNKNILSFSYEGIKYGDIIYDVYLVENQVGTITKIDINIYKLLERCCRRHKLVQKVIKHENVSAVLVSHRIGIQSGVLYRVALKCGCKVYTSAGMDRNTIHVSNDLNEMIEYGYAPSKKDIAELLSLSDEKFNYLFDFVKKIHMSGSSSTDAKFAFSSQNSFFDDKNAFTKKYGLDENKKNIFIMLHAFTDHPHSHFSGMIFSDYADWFLKTLQFAKNDSNVNWIFKLHPSNKFYPTKDVDFEKLFRDTSNNIIFLDHEERLDTRSLIHVADAVITCVGSAGFEIPAMGGVVSITAGNNHYQEFGFSIDPKHKKEYYALLNDLRVIKKLSFKQQKTAQAVYIFIHYLSRVSHSSIPVLTMEEHRNKNIDDSFWNRTIELLQRNRESICAEINTYSSIVKESDFKALRTRLDIVDVNAALPSESV